MEDFRNAVKKVDLVTLIPNGDRNRNQRRVLAELREQGIVFIPVGEYRYKRIEKCKREEVDKYINERIASLRSQYFRSLKPVKDYMTEKQLKELHLGGLEFE